MNYILSFELFEATSLLSIGVPYSVMKSMQINYEISPDAQWKKLKYKKDINKILKKSENNLIISICKNKLFVIFSYNNEYYLETFELIEKDDFGYQNWKRVDRIESSITEIYSLLGRGCNTYVLLSGDWKHDFSSARKLKKSEKEFDEITNQFKKDFAENFTRIIRRMYGNKANIVTNIIIDNLKNIQTNLSDEEIRNVLFQNVERTKEIDRLKRKQKERDPYKLQSKIMMYNSLTIFNEYITNFEDEYSDKYKEYLNIPIMIERWTRDKIFTAFAFYLYTNKLMKL